MAVLTSDLRLAGVQLTAPNRYANDFHEDLVLGTTYVHGLYTTSACSLDIRLPEGRHSARSGTVRSYSACFGAGGGRSAALNTAMHPYTTLTALEKCYTGTMVNLQASW